MKQWDVLDSGVVPFTAADYIAPINCLLVNENRIFIGGSVNFTQERDLVSNELVMFYYQEFDASTTTLYFFNNKLFVANLRRKVSVYDTSTGLLDYAIEGQPEIVEQMSGFREKLLVGEGEQGVRLWDIALNTEIEYYASPNLLMTLEDLVLTDAYIYIARKSLVSISISTSTVVAETGKNSIIV